MKVEVPTGFDDLPLEQPYAIEFEIEGTRRYLFNRYDVPVHADTEQKTSAGKTVRPLGSMVHKDSAGNLAAPITQIWNAVVAGGRYRQNPRSKRGSLATVLREGIEIESLDNDAELLTFHTATGEPYQSWDGSFSSRVKNSGAFAGYVTRERPAIDPGWRLRGRIVVTLPQYIKENDIHGALEMAGRFGGIGDGRTMALGFGRFRINRFEAATLEEVA
jgi:hypothetical protein